MCYFDSASVVVWTNYYSWSMFKCFINLCQRWCHISMKCVTLPKRSSKLSLYLPGVGQVWNRRILFPHQPCHHQRTLCAWEISESRTQLDQKTCCHQLTLCAWEITGHTTQLDQKHTGSQFRLQCFQQVFKELRIELPPKKIFRLGREMQSQVSLLLCLISTAFWLSWDDQNAV